MADLDVVFEKIVKVDIQVQAEMDKIRRELKELQNEHGRRPNNQEGMPEYHYTIASGLNTILTRLNDHTRSTLNNLLVDLIESVNTLAVFHKGEGDSWASALHQQSAKGGKRNSRKGKNRKTRKNRSNRK